MQDDYLEQVSPSGLVLRVNIRHGTFLIFKEGQPVSVNRGGGISQIHPLTHVYFLGAGFSIVSQSYGSINFFEVDRGFLKIPFLIQGTSDVRHIRIPVPFEVDMLPALVVQYKTYWPGPLPAVGDGRRFFVADPEIDRQSIVRIKGRYPRARLMIYRPDEPAAIKIEQQSEGDRAQNKRAIDLIEKSEASMLALNPIFAARVYLRQFDWKRMASLPLYGKVDLADVKQVISFLTAMESKAKTVSELAAHKDAILESLDLFDGLARALNFEMPPVKEYFESHEKNKRQILQTLVSWVEAQMRFYAKDENSRKSDFLRDAVQILKNESFSRIEFMPSDD